MIERVRLVALREVRAVVLQRAFLVLLLAPFGALAAPLVGLDLPQRHAPQLRVDDATGRLVEPLSARLGEAWEVVLAPPVPDEEAARLLYEESGPDALLELPADALSAGRYRLRAARTGDDDTLLRLERLDRAVAEVLVRERLATAGLAEATEALDLEGDLEGVDRPSAESWALSLRVARTGFAFALVLVPTLVAGAQMVGSLVEEKTSQVLEVLLGAVSPVELLAGKILGHLVAAAVLSLAWGGPLLVGLSALVGVGLVGPGTLAALAGFAACAVVAWTALIGGLGAVASDARAAQAMVGRFVGPALLAGLPIGLAAVAAPSSTATLVLSLLPGTSFVAMPARLADAPGPPAWQVACALAGDVAFAAGAVWAGGRLFRLGLLLRSSPDLGTFLRWLRG